MRKFILFIIVLGFVLGLAGFWYWQKNPYSKDILKLEILGPETTVFSEEIEYTVKYKNNGNVRLEEARLIFEFPENTLEPLTSGEISAGGKVLRRKEIGPDELGDIYPGEEKTFKFKCRLFGKEEDIKTARAKMSYRPKNLQAFYDSNTTFTTVIKTTPLALDFDLLSKKESGRDFKFSLNYFSNLNYPLSNLGIKIEYPPGFEFLRSKPSSLSKNDWEIPLLNKAEGGRIEIEGKLSGEIKEQKIFRALLGVWQENEFIVLKEITKGIEIIKPYLYVFQQINSTSYYVADPGDLLHYEIFFRNIGEEPFTNLFLVARLEGKVFDFESIKSESGQFNKNDNTIMWDWRDISELRFLGQGEEGKVEFWINLKKEWEIQTSQDKNVFLRNKILISQFQEEFETKVNSKLVILQKGYFQDEVFGNAGPLPPKVGEATTYTITWQVKNYYNDVRNVKVKAILPQNVRLTGKIFPEEFSSKFTFDNLSREIVWTIKDNEVLEVGTGVLNSGPNISFQVALTPLAEQRGQTALIIDEARVSGDDQWTGEIVEATAFPIDTNLPDDLNIPTGRGIIQ